MEELSPEGREAWEKTGEIPDIQAPPADPPPASPAEPAPSTDGKDSAASEPAKPRKGAEARIGELSQQVQEKLAERRRVASELAADEARLADIRRQLSEHQPGSRPDKPSTTVDALIDRPNLDRPVLTEGEFFEQFPDATVGQFTRYVTRHEVGRAEQARTRQTQHEESTRRSRDQLTAFHTQVETLVGGADAARDFWASIDPALANAMPYGMLPDDQKAKATPLNVLSQEVLTCERPDLVLRHLTDHPEEVDRLTSMASAVDAVRELARLDARLLRDSARPSADTTTVTDPPAQPARSVSSAPKPPTTLGRKPTTEGDEAEDALKRGDTAGYMRVMNAREIAAHGGRR